MFSALATLRGGFRPAILRETTILIIFLVLCGMLAVQLLRDRLGWAISLWHRMRVFRGLVYTAMLVAVIAFDAEAKAFVYFQF
jgi:uncharacterized membrane protein YdcZ (DUF606 family)